MIVLAEKHHGQRKDPGDVQSFMKIPFGRGAISQVNENGDFVAAQLGAPRYSRTDGNLRSHRDRDGKIVLTFRNNAATFIARPVLQNHSWRQSSNEGRALFTKGREHPVGGFERERAGNLRGFLAEYRRVSSQPSFTLQFKGFFVKGAGKNQPLVQLADLIVGERRAKLFVAVAVLIENLKPFDPKVLDGCLRHNGSSLPAFSRLPARPIITFETRI